MEKDGILDEIAALTAQHRELDQLLSGLADEQWTNPTRCTGWDVADVVLHLAQTDEMAIASLEGTVAGWLDERAGGAPVGSVDDGAAFMVERERGAPPARSLARWRDGSGRLDAMFGEDDPRRRVLWVAGELSVRTLAVTRLAESWIHTGDVAEAVGAAWKPHDGLRHVARLAWRTLPYAFARSGRTMSGPVAFALTGPTGESWSFAPDAPPVTVVSGDGFELCMVAARRVDPARTGLRADGPDADAVLSLVRTYA